LASKAYRKKQARQADGPKPVQKPKKKINYAFYIGIVVIIAIAYFIFKAASAPAFIPEAGNSYATGDGTEPVTFIEFGCFTCPFTKQFNLNILPQLMEEYDGKVNFVYRSQPIESHPGSDLAALAAFCAGDQGMYFDYGEMLFRSGSSFTKDQLKSLASQAGLDTVQFNECLDSGKHRAELDMDISDSRKAGVVVTPTVFINGVKVPGLQDISLYRRVINDKLAGK